MSKEIIELSEVDANSTLALKLKKYSPEKLYYFMFNDIIASGNVVGANIHLTMDSNRDITKEETMLTIKPSAGVNSLSSLKIKEEDLFGSMKDLLIHIGVDYELLIRSEYNPSVGLDFSFNAYQQTAMLTKSYGAGQPIVYPALKLNGEAGEVAEKVGKVLRDNNGIFTEEIKKAIIDELADVLWYITAIATDIGYNLDAVAKANLIKLERRRMNNTIKGSGDNR